MNPDTGRIELLLNKEDELDAKRRGLIPLSEADLKEIDGMNRHQRRAWAAKRRHKKGKR